MPKLKINSKICKPAFIDGGHVVTKIYITSVHLGKWDRKPKYFLSDEVSNPDITPCILIEFRNTRGGFSATSPQWFRATLDEFSGDF